MGKDRTDQRIPVAKTYKLYIGGGFPRTESGRYLTAEGPKGEFVANYCRASRKDVRNSVVAARKAQPGWARRSAFNRGQILYRMAEMLESRRGTFERGLVEVCGYKDKAAAAEVDAAVDRWVWYAGWADKFTQVFGNTNPVSSPHFNFTTPEPTGVVVIFAPTKAPLVGLVSAIAPVIVGGNTAVCIVDNDGPTIAIELAEVLATSDLPGGVVNLLTGLRSELLVHAGGHKDVDAVLSFGGDEEERRTLGLEAAETVKRLTLKDEPSDAAGWTDEAMQSPYWIMPFVEFKTAWHPIGI